MRLIQRAAVAAFLLLLAAPLNAQELIEESLVVDTPDVFLSGVPVQVPVRIPGGVQPELVEIRSSSGTLLGSEVLAPYDTANISVTVTPADMPLEVTAAGESEAVSAPVLPGFVSILPPLIAIALALWFKEVIVSLVAGVWLGALFVYSYNPFEAIISVAGRFARDALLDPGRASIVVFSLLLGGMVGIIGKMGATRSMVDAISPFATNRRRGLLATWFAGLVVFFDDYANTLVVGNTMRPVTDRLKISREKLAYIVDSTAAPVAALMFVSTWVGYEIGLIADGYEAAATQSADPAIAQALDIPAFGVFISTIPYLFYPILAIVLVLTLVITGRDFGPMLHAERRANSGGGLFRPGAQLAADTGEAEMGAAGRSVPWWFGVLPVAVLVTTVLWGLVRTGIEALPEGDPANLTNIFGNADPYVPLLWGSLLACVVAVALASGTRVLTLNESVQGVVSGVKSMMMAMMILTLAWSLSDVTNALGTAPYLSQLLSDAIPVTLIPVSVFVVAAATAFATGSSWGTMAILLPIVIPLTIALGGVEVVPGGEAYHILLSSIAAVLAGSIFGDHCSPISDTTVLSSMASGCDHIDHVKTQLPYALTVGGAGLLLGNVATAYGLPAWISLLLGAGTVIGVVLLIGKKVEDGHVVAS